VQKTPGIDDKTQTAETLDTAGLIVIPVVSIGCFLYDGGIKGLALDRSFDGVSNLPIRN
jgi:hypothetical protein